MEKNQAPPRGIRPDLLLEGVKNTVPFLFAGDPASNAEPFAQALLEFDRDPTKELSHAEYFKLCLSAHYATVASFVPTDVDQQIRFKLWHPSLPLATLLTMAETTLEARHWKIENWNARVVRSPDGDSLSGHGGEWLGVAAGAYGALRKKSPVDAKRIADEILQELNREAAVLQSVLIEKNGIKLLSASTIIAHNLGDLDRVLDLWKIPEEDPLRVKILEVGEKSLFQRAGNLNKKWMAHENHRHFALRKPRCLRKSADLFLPIGPFLDDWGRTIARSPHLDESEIASVVEALIEGWEKLETPEGEPTQGYARALAGILTSMPGGPGMLSRHLPSRTAKTLASGKLRTLIDVPRARFEAQSEARAFKEFH